MSLPDPLHVTTSPPADLPKIYSPAGSAVYRKEFDGGSSMKFSFFQNGNSKRARHLARIDYTGPVNAQNVRETMAVTLSIDEPANGAILDSDMRYFIRDVLFGTLTDGIVGKMLNEEL